MTRGVFAPVPGDWIHMDCYQTILREIERETRGDPAMLRSMIVAK